MTRPDKGHNLWSFQKPFSPHILVACILALSSVPARRRDVMPSIAIGTALSIFLVRPLMHLLTLLEPCRSIWSLGLLNVRVERSIVPLSFLPQPVSIWGSIAK